MIEFFLIFVGVGSGQPVFYDGYLPLPFSSYEECVEAHQSATLYFADNPPPFEYALDCYAVVPVPELIEGDPA